MIERNGLERGDRGLHQLLDGAGGIAAVGLAARQARDAIRRHQRIIQCAKQEVTAPDDVGARNVRQALVDRIDEGMAGVVEGLRDDLSRDLVALRRHHGS